MEEEEEKKENLFERDTSYPLPKTGRMGYLNRKGHLSTKTYHDSKVSIYFIIGCKFFKYSRYLFEIKRTYLVRYTLFHNMGINEIHKKL